jgi:hypothetical protein
MIKMTIEEGNITTQEDQIRVFYNTGKQEVDLNCCFLGEDESGYHCRRDLDGAELKTCTDCNLNVVFIKRKKYHQLKIM